MSFVNLPEEESNIHELEAWRHRLSLGKGDKTKSSLANVTLILQHDIAWRGVLGYDERTESPVLVGRPPFLDCPDHLLQAPRDLSDADDVRTVQWLEERYEITVALPQVHSALNAVARAAPFDRVRQYLQGLRWDGTVRLDHWMTDYLGAPRNRYTQAVARMWPVSAVARVFQPGSKADHVLILEGRQGLGKSTALRILAGDEFFGDDIPIVGSKDAQQYLGGLWIVELAEMDAASKAQASTLKRFLTTSMDRYRPPYGRRMIVHPRRCVFAGSVNHVTYLKDSTGGRRFWPVRCGAVDLEALAASRNALWSEAVAAYQAGEPWYFQDPELVQHAAFEQSERLEVDPWEDAISEYLERPGATFLTTSDLLLEAVKMDVARMTKADSNRIGAIMRRLGWKYGEGPSRQRGWRRPAQPTQLDSALGGGNVD